MHQPFVTTIKTAGLITFHFSLPSVNPSLFGQAVGYIALLPSWVKINNYLTPKVVGSVVTDLCGLIMGSVVLLEQSDLWVCTVCIARPINLKTLENYCRLFVDVTVSKSFSLIL